MNSDGRVDATFDVGAGVTGGQAIVGGVYAIILQQDGRILIGGDFTTVDGRSRNRVARLTATGALDASFNPGRGANGVVGAIVLDGYRPLIVGNFTSVGGVKRGRVARNVCGQRVVRFAACNEGEDDVAMRAERVGQTNRRSSFLRREVIERERNEDDLPRIIERLAVSEGVEIFCR